MDCPHCGATSESVEPKCGYCGKMKVSADVLHETAKSFARSCEEQLEKAVINGHGWSIIPWILSIIGAVGVWFGLRHIGLGFVTTIICTVLYLLLGLIVFAVSIDRNERRSMNKLWTTKLVTDLDEFLRPMGMSRQAFELLVFDELAEASYLREILRSGEKASPTLVRHLEAAASAIEARDKALASSVSVAERAAASETRAAAPGAPSAEDAS